MLENEMRMVTEMGADKTKLVYANPVRSIDHLKYSKENGIDLLVFDRESELEKISKNHPDARLLMRIATNDDSAMHPLSLKFGAKRRQERLKVNNAHLTTEYRFPQRSQRL